MSVSCASRFSVLKIEDDDYDSNSSDGEKLKQKKLADSKGISNIPENKNKSKKKKKKTPANKECLEPSSEIPKSRSTKQSKRPANDKQWEEWLQKDVEYVSESFESDLQKALLLSKLEYEEKKELYEAPTKQEEEGGAKKKKKNNQSKKMMSLEDFNNLPLEASCLPAEPPKPLDNCADFFDQISEATLEIVTKENRNKINKRLEATGSSQDASLPCGEGFEVENVRSMEYEERLKEREKEIEALKLEVYTLKEELKECKNRKRRLCKLMFEGEMRDKAALLVQVEQLTKVKDDLTEQFTELHAALEQERSKVHQLQNELKKNQGKRRDERKNSQKES